MPNTTTRISGAALLGAVLMSCSAEDAEAAEEEPETAAERELRQARESLANWSAMKAEDFRQTAERALQATERRIETLRERVASSDAAADARRTLQELEQERDRLSRQLSELGDKAADEVERAREAIVDGYGEFQGRIEKAWRALAGEETGEKR